MKTVTSRLSSFCHPERQRRISRFFTEFTLSEVEGFRMTLTGCFFLAVIGTFLGLILWNTASAATLSAGDLIKASSASVYYYGGDGKRYVFPNEKTYTTWYSGFSSVKTITDSELAAIAIGGNVTYRPGVKMIKITSDPRVYAVSKRGVLHWVTSESIAVSLYGSNWNQKIDDVSDAFFTNYTVGSDITSASAYSPSSENSGSASINDDKSLAGSAPSVPAPAAEPTPSTSAGAPRIFFTDLQSGPNTGGQDNLGAFITIYGEGFGSSRGSSRVTIGGAEVAKYILWGQDNGVARDLDMIVVQPGSAVASGNIVVTVNGQSSNALSFTVRSGDIFFVISSAANASDSNSGTYNDPWRSITRPRKAMNAGDIVYIKGGTFNSSDSDHPGWDAVLLLEPEGDANGTSSAPIAYIGYPGSRPTIQGPNSLRRGIYFDNGVNYYVIANMEFTGYAGNLQVRGTGHRLVGNYSHDGIYSEGAVIGITGTSSGLKIYGNYMRDNGGTGDLAGHGFYVQGFGTNRDIDFGWNEIRNQRGRRAIQLFGHQSGDWMDNISIHDNLITGSIRNNIIIGGSDGGTDVIGTIYVRNNIIANGDDQGLRVNDSNGRVYIQNNTFYNNGATGYDGNAQIYIERAGTGRITVQNNIMYALSGETYYQLEPGLSSSVVNASNNLVYNAGSCESWDSGCINANPLFVNLSSEDYRLSSGSPAIDAGASGVTTSDYNGVARPQGSRSDIGAFEYSP